MNFFSHFEANALAGPNVDQPAHPHSQKEDRITQTQPASQHTDVDLVVSIGDLLATNATATNGRAKRAWLVAYIRANAKDTCCDHRTTCRPARFRDMPFLALQKESSDLVTTAIRPVGWH